MLVRAVSALAALLFSSSVGALQFKSNITYAPDVAAVIPTYPPDFKKVVSFLKDWENCAVGQKNLDIYMIFSSQQESNQFDEFYGGRGPWKALVMSDPNRKERLASWKKLDGLAQLLVSSHHKYVLIMDCEIAVKNCNGFEDLANNLDRKYRAKTWYGSSRDQSKDSSLVGHGHRAACSVVDCNHVGSVDALRAASNDFKVFPWWNDVPWVETLSAKKMFENWGERVEAKNSMASSLGEGLTIAGADATRFAQRDKVLGPGDYVGILHAAISAGIFSEPTRELAGLDPVAVSGEIIMKGPDSMLSALARAFEHLVYQYYMVEYHGFVFHDLNKDGLGFPDCEGSGCHLSNLEAFWDIYSEKKQASYIKLVKPLWIKDSRHYDQVGYPSVTNYIPLAFHTDRVQGARSVN